MAREGFVTTNQLNEIDLYIFVGGHFGAFWAYFFTLSYNIVWSYANWKTWFLPPTADGILEHHD